MWVKKPEAITDFTSISTGHPQSNPLSGPTQRQAVLWNASPLHQKEDPLTSELRLEWTKLFWKQPLPDFINTCTNNSWYKCLLQRRASYFSLHWQEIPSQHTFTSYTRQRRAWGNVFSSISCIKIFWERSQREQYGNCAFWNKLLAPEMVSELSPTFLAAFGRKPPTIPRALSTCCQYLCQPRCSDAALPSPGWECAPPTAASCAIRWFCGIISIYLCSHRCWQLSQTELV